MIDSSSKHTAYNATTPSTHTGPTQHRRPNMKEHDHHWDSQQDSNQSKIFINFNIF
jgi:hypothetical protein